MRFHDCLWPLPRAALAAGRALVVAFTVATGLAQCGAADTFTARLAPLLEQHCLRCHGSKTHKGGLSLATRRDMLAGGDSGPAIVPGKPAESLLLDQVSGAKPRMPRGGNPLSADQVSLLREWVAAGAPWPEKIVLRDRSGDDAWWSLEPIKKPALPRVKNAAWVRTPIDAFVLKAQEAQRVSPSVAADPGTLLRRVTYDLHGLPPTPEEIRAFISDTSPNGYENVVDRLLASPHYGERWARHWLDVVHYGDTHGYDKDKRRPNAWPYRDYVIRSLNNDTPFARFIEDQIAGDVFRPEDPDAVRATGFVAAGPWDFVGHVELREGTVDKAITRTLDRDDMVSNVIATFMSLTVHCARCHDHKFDPIPQGDYYRLQAIFAGIDRGDRGAGEDGWLARSEPVYAVVPVDLRPIHVLPRGDVQRPGALVGAGGLECVRGPAVVFPNDPLAPEGLRRAALARWVSDPRNPLTWRSIVNRVWHYHFGRGIVDTPNDFGRNGSRPTHPELLDWLAAEFRDGGGSLKKLHRLIVLSATYRQASAHNPAHARIDADNRLLWRMNRQRLDAESVRDAVLAVSGALRTNMGGPGFDLFRFQDDHSPVYDHGSLKNILDPATYRRTVYRFTVRSVPNPFLDCLDCADPNINVPVRNTTLTALQALALLNDPFMFRQAEIFAERLQRFSRDPYRAIERAYLLALGRTPSPEEVEEMAAYAGKHGLASACRLLFNANEFVFVD